MQTELTKSQLIHKIHVSLFSVKIADATPKSVSAFVNQSMRAAALLATEPNLFNTRSATAVKANVSMIYKMLSIENGRVCQKWTKIYNAFVKENGVDYCFYSLCAVMKVQ